MSAQSMRGLHATLAMERGGTESLGGGGAGHESFSTTAQSYATRESVSGARQRLTISASTGNKTSAGENGEGAQEREVFTTFCTTLRVLSRDAVSSEPFK